MEVHKKLGKGFIEIVYSAQGGSASGGKDAIEYECKSRKYEYDREKD